MSKITDKTVLMGYAWIDDEGNIIWAMKEDFAELKKSERPKDATPVVIEITPTNEWVDNKENEHNLLYDVQDKLNRFSSDLKALERSLSVEMEI